MNPASVDRVTTARRVGVPSVPRQLPRLPGFGEGQLRPNKAVAVASSVRIRVAHIQTQLSMDVSTEMHTVVYSSCILSKLRNFRAVTCSLGPYII